MSRATESLQQLTEKMVDAPELYPDINTVWDGMSGFLYIFSLILGVLAIGILMAFVIRYTIDVLTVLTKGTGLSDKLSNYSSQGARDSDDLWTYVKSSIPSTIIALVLAGLLITGQALPVAAKLMQVTGYAIDSILNIEFERIDRNRQAPQSRAQATGLEFSKGFSVAYLDDNGKIVKMEWDKRLVL